MVFEERFGCRLVALKHSIILSEHPRMGPKVLALGIKHNQSEGKGEFAGKKEDKWETSMAQGVIR